MGDWMASAFSLNSNDEPKEYKALIQKVYAYAKQMDCEDYIEYVKNVGKYYSTQKFEMESKVRGHINHYENESFWINLIDRLSARDVCKKHKVKSPFDLSTDVRIEALCENEAIWGEEFSQHGLDRLMLDYK